MIKISELKYIKTLDGWRAIAIVSVLVCHLQITLQNKGIINQSEQVHFIFYNLGVLGVNIFFGLSGFLITNRILALKSEGYSLTHTLKIFYINRLFRIIPASFLYLVVLFFLASINIINLYKGELLASFLFFRNYTNIAGYTHHFWSLSVEEHFYLFWPLLLIFYYKKKALKLATTFCIIVAFWRHIEFQSKFLPNLLGIDLVFNYRTDIRLDALLWGAVVALLVDSQNILYWSKKKYSSAIFYFLFLFSIAIHFIYFPLKYTFIAITIPIFIFGSIVNDTSWLSCLLELKLVKYIGRLSYSLYLWHELFFFPDQMPTAVINHVISFPINIILSFTCAALSYHLVEKPLIRYGKSTLKIFKKKDYK